MITPKWIFIVPYRNREPQKHFFENYMSYLMEDYEVGKDYLILFIEQKDERPFNRGAIKNIGFISIKKLFPDTYKDITIVFNDVDCLPYCKNLLSYGTTHGNVKHHYGFEFALGGIVSITAKDFETLNGFGNYWTWGFEDNVFQNRVQKNGFHIDRSCFFELHDLRILHLNDGNRKSLNRQYMYELIIDDGSKGISTITNLEYKIEGNVVEVACFDVEYNPWIGKFEEYDLRNGRDLSTPITKEMMIKNAKLGNNLDTLRFIDNDGVKKTMADILKENEEQAQQMKEKPTEQAEFNMSLHANRIMNNANNLKSMQHKLAHVQYDINSSNASNKIRPLSMSMNSIKTSETHMKSIRQHMFFTNAMMASNRRIGKLR